MTMGIAADFTESPFGHNATTSPIDPSSSSISGLLASDELLGQAAPVSDLRDQIGLERKGRLLARDIAQQVAAEAGHA